MGQGPRHAGRNRARGRPTAAASTPWTPTSARSPWRIRTPRSPTCRPRPRSTEGARVPAGQPKEIPPETAEIKPHPYGVELGVLMQMFRDTKARNLRSCLTNDFSRVSSRTADEICERPKCRPSAVPERDRPRRGREDPQGDPGHQDHGAADGLHRAHRRGSDPAGAQGRSRGRLLRFGDAARHGVPRQPLL